MVFGAKCLDVLGGELRLAVDVHYSQIVVGFLNFAKAKLTGRPLVPHSPNRQ